jgi:hypothetical protein
VSDGSNVNGDKAGMPYVATPKGVSVGACTEEFNKAVILRCCTTNSSIKENEDGGVESLLP